MAFNPAEGQPSRLSPLADLIVLTLAAVLLAAFVGSVVLLP